MNSNSTEQTFYKITYASLIVLAIGVFSSVTFSAVSHILLIPPAIYFSIQSFKNKNIKLSFSYWALVAIVISIFLSVIFNLSILDNPLRNIFKGKYFVITLIGIPAIRATIENYLDQKKIKLLLWLFRGTTTLASLSGIIGIYTGFNPLKFKSACHATRSCGLYGMYMTYGYGIGLFMVLMTGLLIYRKKVSHLISSKVLVLFWLVNLAGLFFSYARGAWIGFLVAVPFYFYKKHKRLFLGGITAGLLALVIAFSASQTVRDTFLKRQGSNDRRIAFYETALVAFKERPVFGWGHKNFEKNVKKIKSKYRIAYRGLGGHAHNNLLEYLASTGIIGFVCLLLFKLSWLRESYKRDDFIAELSFPFVLSFIVSGMFQYTFGDGENLFLIMGLFSIF